MSARSWIKHPTEPVLCMDGQPIRIRMAAGKPWPFQVEVDGRQALPYWTLVAAKINAVKFADELEAFA